jgi:hypothetical protein
VLPDRKPAVQGTVTVVRVTATTHTTDDPHPNPPPSWALNPQDWRAHAIDTDADHPYGLWVARCGCRIVATANLHETPPGWMCMSCARWTDR